MSTVFRTPRINTTCFVIFPVYQTGLVCFCVGLSLPGRLLGAPVNFDASLLGNHEAGFGFIARNKDSEVLAATTSTMGAILSPVLA